MARASLAIKITWVGLDLVFEILLNRSAGRAWGDHFPRRRVRRKTNAYEDVVESAGVAAALQQIPGVGIAYGTAGVIRDQFQRAEPLSVHAWERDLPERRHARHCEPFAHSPARHVRGQRDTWSPAAVAVGPRD